MRLSNLLTAVMSIMGCAATLNSADPPVEFNSTLDRTAEADLASSQLAGRSEWLVCNNPLDVAMRLRALTLARIYTRQLTLSL